ncbi:MAG: acylphosphatase [Candidatus Cloacimonadia bacterium]
MVSKEILSEVELKTLDILIKGRVQGVGYRAFVLKYARMLNLTGTVRNDSDGSVQVVARGYDENLMIFLRKLKRGPIFASVKEIHYTELKHANDYEDFTVLY